jgi:hypothetical protein
MPGTGTVPRTAGASLPAGPRVNAGSLQVGAATRSARGRAASPAVRPLFLQNPLGPVGTESLGMRYFSAAYRGSAIRLTKSRSFSSFPKSLKPAACALARYSSAFSVSPRAASALAYR